MTSSKRSFPKWTHWQVRETLTAYCVAALHAAIEGGDTEQCANVLALAASCETPALAPLLSAAEECARRRPAEVRIACAARGLDDVEGALRALAAAG